MKVITTKVGFYGKLRKVGEEFDIKNKKELGSWMKLVKAVKSKKEEEPEEEPETESEEELEEELEEEK